MAESPRDRLRVGRLGQIEHSLRFIHLAGFSADWNGLKLTDDDLRILQIQVMIAPNAGRVVQGTGGLRKVRFAPPSWHRGKRGGLRVLYAVFPEHAVAILAAAYDKVEKENISAAEKRALHMILREIGELLDRGR